MARAYASRLAEAQLASLLEELAAHLRYVYAESATAARWTPFGGFAIEPELLRGRAFGPHCEVQFRREEGDYAVTVLTDVPRMTSSLRESLDLGELDAEEVTYLLWGRRDSAADAWTEPGFPQRWSYPVEGAPTRVAVQAVEYRDRDNAQLQFVRYAGLIAVEEAG